MGLVSNDGITTGGLVGYNCNTSNISNCYSSIFSVSESFLIVAENLSGSTITNSYLYTANYMKTSEFLTELNIGLSENLWSMDSNNINNGFPVLSWQESITN